MVKKSGWAGDFWGGSAAMLVALPAAIAFGVTTYAAMGGSYGAYGALAGVIGVIAVAIVAYLAGGSHRLISAPSAPAAAVLSAFALEYLHQGYGPQSVFAMMLVVALGAGVFQLLFGLVGLGRLIKYMPYPVVSGYLSGVGLYIIASQTPKFLGLPQGSRFWESLNHPAAWEWQSILIGASTIGAMVLSQKIFRTFPAVILALAAGVALYFSLGAIDPSLYVANNPFVIGELGGMEGDNFLRMLEQRFGNVAALGWDQVWLLLIPALTLAALLSIDTLKTCIILDSMTHSFHRPDRELIAQGSGNIVSSLVGGMPGSGTMGATMVNLSGGATTRFSGLVEGIAALVAFVVLGGFIAWIPVAALSGILIVIGLRMIDKNSVLLLKSSKTALDFFIILAVAITALWIGLIAAAGVGLALAVMLYIAQQIGASVVYRHIDGSEARSKIIRSREQENILCGSGGIFSVYELHGSLFFGTANQLYSMLRNDLDAKKYIIMDMKRVQTVDLTAAHILLQIKDILHEKEGYLILCRLPHKLPTGDDLESYFNHVGLLRHLSPIKVFGDLEDAIEWVEEKIIREFQAEENVEVPYELADFDLFRGRKTDTLEEIRGLLELKSFSKGETIFSAGEGSGELYLIRRGMVRIMLPVSERSHVHLNTLGQGNFFGEFSFLEGTSHYAGAVAGSDTELYVITREAFDLFSQHHKKASLQFMQCLASVLALRLRETSTDLLAEYDV